MQDAWNTLATIARRAGVRLKPLDAGIAAPPRYPQARPARAAGGFWIPQPFLADERRRHTAAPVSLPYCRLSLRWSLGEAQAPAKVVQCRPVHAVLSDPQTGRCAGYALLYWLKPRRVDIAPADLVAALRCADEPAQACAQFLAQTCLSTEGLFRRSPALLHVAAFEMLADSPHAGMGVWPLQELLQLLAPTLDVEVATIRACPPRYEAVGRIPPERLLRQMSEFVDERGRLIESLEYTLGAMVTGEDEHSIAAWMTTSIRHRFDVVLDDDTRCWFVIEPSGE